MAGDGGGERENLQKDAAAINKKQMAEDRGGGLVWQGDPVFSLGHVDRHQKEMTRVICRPEVEPGCSCRAGVFKP